jgi:RNA polymerase sigma-70 factor (ECF subfamily)
LVQETLIAAVDASRTFRGESSVRTWLVRILVNRAAMSRRATSRREKHEDALVAGQRPARPPTESADAKLDLSAMLETLNAQHRQVIVLRELQGLSYEQMAEALDVPRGTVESRLHRAREELRKRFKGY